MLILHEVKVFGAHKERAHCQVVLMMVGAFTTSLDCSTEVQCAAPSLYPQECPTAQAMTCTAQADLHTCLSCNESVNKGLRVSVADVKTCGRFNS